MAITIWQYPQEWTPAYNDQWITALSTQIAQPNFKYKVEVTVAYDLNGSPATKTLTYYPLPRPDGYLVFNAKESVQNFVQHFFKPNDYTILEAVNERVEVTVTITETWTGTPGAAIADYTYFAWNACLTEKQMFSFDFTQYISDDVRVRVHSIATAGFNSYPFEKQTLNSDVYMHFVKIPELNRINYKLIDTNETDILEDADLTGSMTNNKIYQINVSPQLAISNSWSITVGMFIQVDFLSAANDTLYSYTYKVEELCTKHEVNRIYYLNRRGGVSSFPFEMLSTQMIDIKTNEVRLGRNVIDSGGYVYKPYIHENNIVSTQETYMKTLQTNWLTTQEMIYLEELFSSPKKWIVNEAEPYGDSYNYIPVTMINKPYLLNKHENEKLFNYGIDVKFSTQETRQRAI